MDWERDETACWSSEPATTVPFKKDDARPEAPPPVDVRCNYSVKQEVGVRTACVDTGGWRSSRGVEVERERNEEGESCVGAGGDVGRRPEEERPSVDSGPGGLGASPSRALGRAWLNKVRGTLAGWVSTKGHSTP